MSCCETDHADIELEDGETVVLGFYIEHPNGTAFDLTGLTLNLVWSTDSGGSFDGAGAAAMVVTPAAGYVEFQFNPAAMRLQPGVDYFAKFVDSYANPKPRRHPQGAPLTMRVHRRT